MVDTFSGDTKYVLVDLDGTVCNVAHRLHLAQAKQWDDFHALLSRDEPVAEIVELLRMIEFVASVGWPVEILAVTGRSEKYRPSTFDWFIKHRIPIDEVLMRPDDDFTSDGELKIKLVEQFMAERYGPGKDAVLNRVLFAIEDRDRVVEAYRAYGIKCWQVAQGEY